MELDDLFPEDDDDADVATEIAQERAYWDREQEEEEETADREDV